MEWAHGKVLSFNFLSANKLDSSKAEQLGTQFFENQLC